MKIGNILSTVYNFKIIIKDVHEIFVNVRLALKSS